MNLKDRDRKFLARGSDANNIQIIGAKGSKIISETGKKYIDFVSGWCVGNIGWGNKTVRKAIKDFKGPEYVMPSFLYKPWVELAELLAKMTPGNLVKSFRTTGGTEAVEFALRAANVITKRHKYISIEGSYHGNSIGAMSVGSSSFRKHQKNLLLHTYKINPPLDAKAASKVEKWLASKEIAALIMEPIICNLAVAIPDKEFMQRIQKACKKYGTLLIMDEVATGFGRTGKMFATEHFNLKPDMLCLAKGISGGYGALGALVTTEAVAKAMEFELSSYSTYGWHPISVVATLANIQFLRKHENRILKNVALMGRYFKDRLSKMNFKAKTEIRQAGLALGIEFKTKNYAKKIVTAARKKGLFLALHSEKEITIFPALNIDKVTAKRGLDIFESCL